MYLPFFAKYLFDLLKKVTFCLSGHHSSRPDLLEEIEFINVIAAHAAAL